MLAPVHAVQITTDGGTFEVTAPYQLVDYCRMLPARRWDAGRKLWTVPATPLNATYIRSVFEGQKIQGDAGYKHLVDMPPPGLCLDGITPPKNKTIWDHQIEGAEFILDRFGTGMLAMEMRTGKTLASIIVLNSLKPDCTFILCPSPAVKVWPSTFEEWTDGQFMVCGLSEGSTAKRLKEGETHLRLARARKQPAVIVLNYEAAWREPLRSFILKHAKCLIMDESHRAKAPGGKQSRFCLAVSKVVPYIMALTGTPMPHSPMDIYAQARAVDPYIFGTSATQFRHKYAIMGGYKEKQIVAWKNTEEMQAKLRLFMFQVKYEDVMPDSEETVDYLSCELNKDARELYKSMESDFFAYVDGKEVTAQNALVKLLRLQQITSGSIKRDDGEYIQVGDSKERLLEETLQDIGESPVVVYCKFDQDLQAVRRVTEKLGRTHGEVSGSQKDLTDSATMPNHIDVMGVQIQSGIGIDLSRSHYAIFYSTGFSLGNYDQARFRQKGVNQQKPLSRIHLVAKGTIDETVFKALKKRKEVVQYVLDYGRD